MLRPQFSLKTMLWLMVVVSLSLAVGRRIGGNMAEVEAERQRQQAKAEWEQRFEEIQYWNRLNAPMWIKVQGRPGAVRIRLRRSTSQAPR